jgi:hypothetical protein
MADKPKPGTDPLTAVVDPARRLLRPETHTHEPGSLLRELLRPAGGQPPLATAVVHPCDAVSLGGALQAAQAGLIVPVLVGPRASSARRRRPACRSTACASSIRRTVMRLPPGAWSWCAPAKSRRS